MAKRFRLERVQSEKSLVYLPANFDENKILSTIGFGSSECQAEFLQQPNGRNVISISSKLSKELHLPSHIETIHVFTKDNCLHLGPLIGIFSSGFTPFQVRPIGERSFLFSKILSSQSAAGVVPFLFGDGHIDWEHGLINAYFFTDKGWEQEIVPFPNVVYDRLPNRRSEKLKVSKEIKERLEKDYLIPWYNPGFFNKLEIFEKLYNTPEAEIYLPETAPFQSFHQIEQMLSEHGQVFIKPQNGSLGLGVYQIIYDKKNGAYYCRYRDQQNKLQRFSSLESLAKVVFAKRSLDRMLVQQGIYLIKHQGRPLDFRVHANKDEKGEWIISAIAAKMAGNGSPTTHLNNGGEVKTLEEIYPDEQNQKLYREKLEKAALILSNALERQIGGIVAEIGFDFGIDRNGDIWLFEANSKPGRSIFSHPELREVDLLTRKLALSFGIYLTEQTFENPEELFR
ncbi:YheC/YheD family protein [Falsibacillus pallidus]|uniref:YheC/D-like protein n=1 Tax=Falsibacillus pallidus TaxID=493781 RepID=A0A370GXA7_9BACI|nr:YheC/YheD family protein [Falsibacillus pallidus]RDI47890.1 YheC/D-like protein [Falsibacillus pallidus]